MLRRPGPQVVSERLSAHVLANYDMFVRGVGEVVQVEAELQVGEYCRGG